MKLNLGCGEDFRPGWLNVDCRPLYPEGPDFLCCDLLHLDGRLEDSSCSEIVPQSVLEYLSWREVDSVLVMLGKKLRPGGTLLVHVPDGEAVARAWVEGKLSHHDAQRQLYGEQGHSQEVRKSLWTMAETQRRLQMIGLQIERLEQSGGQIVALGRRLS
jgi:predicted SAM-dependent methyltransferase